MQPVERILQKIWTWLASLPAGAKLLAVALLATVLAVLLLAPPNPASDGMLPLGLTTASMDVRADAVSYLDSAGIPYEDRGNDVYIPAEQRLSVLGRLNEQKIVGVDEINFNSLIDLGSNPLHSPNHQRQMLLVAKMNAIKGMLAVRRDVGFVDIVIDEKTGLPGIGQARIPPVAIVSIQMRGEPMTQEFANAVGAMVAGSQSGLKLEDVTVVDLTSMRPFRPRANDSANASGYLEQQARIEEHYRKRFEPQLVHIPGAVVSVTAVVRNTRETRRETTVDDPKIAPKSSETREYQGGDGGRRNDPGSNVGSNLPARIGGNSADTPAVESMTREERESRFGGSETVIEDHTGYALQVNAVVGVPRSFLVKLFEEEQRTGGISASADPAIFQAFVEEQTARLESDLAPLIRTDPLQDAVPGKINVWMLPDINAPMAAATFGEPAVDTAGLVQPSGGDSGMVRNVGLGALGFLGLVMMFLMVRGAGSRNASRSPDLKVVRPREIPAGSLPGHSPGRNGTREAAEADESLQRTQHLLRQINQMVSSSADDAATVIERWVTSNGR